MLEVRDTMDDGEVRALLRLLQLFGRVASHIARAKWLGAQLVPMKIYFWWSPFI